MLFPSPGMLQYVCTMGVDMADNGQHTFPTWAFLLSVEALSLICSMMFWLLCSLLLTGCFSRLHMLFPIPCFICSSACLLRSTLIERGSLPPPRSLCTSISLNAFGASRFSSATSLSLLPACFLHPPLDLLPVPCFACSAAFLLRSNFMERGSRPPPRSLCTSASHAFGAGTGVSAPTCPSAASRRSQRMMKEEERAATLFLVNPRMPIPPKSKSQNLSPLSELRSLGGREQGRNDRAQESHGANGC
jgi:hypothetical protein